MVLSGDQRGELNLMPRQVVAFTSMGKVDSLISEMLPELRPSMISAADELVGSSMTNPITGVP